MTKKILVTGASSYIGCHLRESLGEHATYVYRTVSDNNQKVNTKLIIKDYMDTQSWKKALTGIDTVVHLAGLVHIKQKNQAEDWNKFKSVNCDITEALAKLASECNVKKFIFLSSIAVLGNGSRDTYNEESLYNPKTYYGLSKAIAEVKLGEIARNTEMKIIIIRIPMVYATDAPGNCQKLIKWIKKGYFLPFTEAHNQRSFLHITTLKQYLVKIIDSNKIRGGIYCIADESPMSTHGLTLKLSEYLGITPRFISIPTWFFYFLKLFFSKSLTYKSLFCDFIIDTKKIKSTFEEK